MNDDPASPRSDVFSIDLTGELATDATIRHADSLIDWLEGVESGSFTVSVMSLEMIAGGVRCFVHTEALIADSLAHGAANSKPEPVVTRAETKRGGTGGPRCPVVPVICGRRSAWEDG